MNSPRFDHKHGPYNLSKSTSDPCLCCCLKNQDRCHTSPARVSFPPTTTSPPSTVRASSDAKMAILPNDGMSRIYKIGLGPGGNRARRVATLSDNGLSLSTPSEIKPCSFLVRDRIRFFWWATEAQSWGFLGTYRPKMY